MRSLVAAICLLPIAGAYAQHEPSDEQILKDIHRELVDAHIEGDLDKWMSMESAYGYASVNGGRVTFPSLEERRERRASYIGTATYTIYRDLQEPTVRISDDGTLGWLIAEVELEGAIPGDDGEINSFHDIWAWIELYEKTDDGWKIVGNVSNKRE